MLLIPCTPDYLLGVFFGVMMNVVSAAKSGRPYKRLGMDNWLTVSLKDDILLTIEDVLAQDWEVKDDGVIITREKYWDAVAQVLKENDTVIPQVLHNKFISLLEKLGL